MNVYYWQENRQSLVVVKLNDFEDSKLNKELTYLMSSLTFMTWPKTEYEEDAFWQKLKVTLMKKSASYANGSMIWSIDNIIIVLYYVWHK